MYKPTLSHKQTNIMNNTKKDFLLGKNMVKKQDMDMKRGIVHTVGNGLEILNTIKFLTLKTLVLNDTLILNFLRKSNTRFPFLRDNTNERTVLCYINNKLKPKKIIKFKKGMIFQQT